MFCDYLILPITGNCDSALRQLRDAHQRRTLWIGSVCIDQSSLEEKQPSWAHGRHYGHTRCILVWLGASNEKTDLAFEYVKRLAAFLPKVDARQPLEVHEEEIRKVLREMRGKKSSYIIIYVLLLISNSDRSDEIYFRDNPNCLLDARRRSLIEEIMDRSWFQRAWTLQEVALARQCFVLCGITCIEWNDFVAALFLIGEFPNNILYTTVVMPRIIAHVTACVSFSQNIRRRPINLVG